MAAAGILAVDVDEIVRGDVATGWERAIPDGMGGFSGEKILAHGATVGWTRTSI